MQLDASFYNLLMDASGAMWGAAAASQPEDKAQEPPPPLLQLRRGRAESAGWFLIQAAEFEPEPLTVARLRVRDVYGAARLVGALLELMASERWLLRKEEETYALAPAGRKMLEHLLRQREGTLATLSAPAGVDGERLASVLGQLVEASLEAGDPPGTWCLAHSRNRAPEPAAPPLVRLAQQFADFNAFRDDAHMAAWRPYGVDGRTWEAFAFLCAGRAESAAELAEQLHYRGYDEGAYTASLSELRARGWLAANGGRYAVTEKGRTIRSEVEARTDSYFYGPWTILTDGELEGLQALLCQFRDGFRARISGED